MPAPWDGLLGWWFGIPLQRDADELAQAQGVAEARSRLWFGYRAEQDEQARERFAALAEQALAGELDAWCASPQGWLGLLLLLDQLPRMIHRGTPAAFAGDARARVVLEYGLAEGLDAHLPAIARVFAYLVLEHAEDIDAQCRSEAAFTALSQAKANAEPFAGFLDFARRHRQVIERFGRFPHRNAILGRQDSEAEAAFLAEPGSRF